MRRRSLLGASVLAGLGSAGCQDAHDNVIRFWAMGSEAEALPPMLRAFESENPGVRVKLESLPWLSAHEKILTAFAGDALPDMAQLGNSWVPEMAALGALEPLTPWLARAPQIALEDYFPGILLTNYAGAELLGIPWYVDTRLLYVRQDLLERAGIAQVPRSWDAWLHSMATLQASGMPTPIYLPTDEFAPLLALALQTGDDLLKDSGMRGNFSGAGFRAALALYMTMFKKGYAPDLSRNTVANVWQEMERGSFAYYISGPWNISEFKKRFPPALQNSWSTAPLPGPQGLGASVAAGASLVMFKHSRIKPLALKLMAYLSRVDVQQNFYRLTGNLPPRRSTWQSPMANGQSLAQDRYARAFATQLEQVKPAPLVPEGERIVQEMQLAAARAVHEQGPIEPVVAALDARVDAILEKRRWMQQRRSA